MLWLVIIILAYLFFAVAVLGDRYLLIGPPVSKSYAFYVGVLGGLVLFLIPFVGFLVPSFYLVLFCLLTGAIFIFALLGLFEALEKFEASRIIPAIGGFIPIFTFFLVYFFSGMKKMFGPWELFAFIFLLLGSVLITIESGKKISLASLKISAITAFLFANFFVLTKYVYIMLPFWTGFIWIRIGAFSVALFFIFFKEVREEIFAKKRSFNKKTGTFFLLNQGIGVIAGILQNWSIALADLVYLSIINALQGIQYVFIFVFSILLSLKSPNILKEKISKKIIFRKALAILFISLGLVFLALNEKI